MAPAPTTAGPAFAPSTAVTGAASLEAPFPGQAGASDVTVASPITGGGEPAHAETAVGDTATGRIGRYVILRLLGEGGFGSVYLAEQKVPVRRKVALKVVKLGMDTAEVLQRFEAERHSLALMDHPNIARVYDAGVNDRGQPYFAMEYVEGVPLNQYVDEQRRTIDERLALFVDICRAVQHAHGKGLIHRDLKPGNIIIAVVDGVAIPKVIDFGIAKVTGPNISETGYQTESGRLIGTPEYMSPEQCAGSADIDTRTDVYALGVILYELLVGALPFDSKALRAGGLEGITRTIREVEPPRPSARVTSLDVDRDSALIARITEARRIGIKHLQRTLKGDLDWIVLRAIEKDRNRRYDTANALAMDVQRHLGDEPVAAGPPDWRYRFLKFARRNKATFAGLTGVAAALVAGVIVATVGFVQASRQRDLAVAADHVAQVKRAEAEDSARTASAALEAERRSSEKNARTLGFYTDLFSSVDPDKARGREVTVREILDQAATNVDRAALDPAVEAQLRNVFGSTFAKLGNQAAAEAQLRRALALAEAQTVRDPELLYEVHNRLGIALRDGKKYDEAGEQFNAALALAQEKYPEPSVQVAAALQNIAVLNEAWGRYPAAERYLRRALDDLTRLRRPEAATVRNNLASVYHNMGDVGSAEGLYRQALADIERARRPGQDPQTDPLVAAACRNLGLVLHDKGEHQDAEAYLQRAVAIWRKVLPPTHPDYRSALDLLGDVLTQQNKIDAAEPVIREGISIREGLLGHDAAETLDALANLANLHQRLGQYDKALAVSGDILERATRSMANESDRSQATALAGYLSLHATLLLDSGRPADAEPFAARALALRSKFMGPSEWRRANAALLLGAIRAEQGHAAEAEPGMLEAITALRQDRQAPAVTLQRARARMARLYDLLKQPDKAAAYR